MLMKKKFVDLIFTSDGKEYLTPSQLVNDILGELYVNGGRVNFVQLSKSIGVDLSHITGHINEIIHENQDIHTLLGQLIDSTYITKIAGEINEKLAQQGNISIGDLTIQYDLPADFLQQQVLDKYLGKLIFGEQDKNNPQLYFTESFILRSKAKIRGALIGITRPTSISVILNHIEMTDKLFFSLFDQISPFGFLTSRTSGASYVPNVYSRSQNEWVNNFYKQNGYIEFDALSRLGISDYKTYLKKQFANEELFMLQSCTISKSIIERLQADIDECISSKSYVDLQTNLPSVFNEEDIQLTVDKVLTPQRLKQTVVINNFILSKTFIDQLGKSCESLVQEKAKQTVESGKYQQYQTDLILASNKSQKVDVDFEDTKVDKREERRKKAAGGKAGGGQQGRETKTKSTKKSSRGGTKNVDVDYDTDFSSKKVTLQIISLEDVKNLIQNKLEDEGLDELLQEIAAYLLLSLNENALEIAATLYATTVSDRTASRRNTHNDVQNKVNVLLGDIRLFEKGLKLLPADLQPLLYKYLLKTLCTDIVNEILNYIANEEGLNTTADNFTNEQRLKFANDLPNEYRASLQPLIKTLSGQTIDDFVSAVEESLTACSMIVKKIDKKKDRLVIMNHKHNLIDQLDKCEEPALALHLTSLILFISATQNILHASGRHVASILAFLRQFLSAEQAAELSSYHGEQQFKTGWPKSQFTNSILL